MPIAPPSLPAAFEQFLAQLATTHQVYIVGGWLRDTLRGATPNDADFATDAAATVVRAVSARHGLRIFADHVAEVHGTYRLTSGRSHEVLDLATLREDLRREGARHAAVQFTASIHGDLARRDLTINGMAAAYPWHERGGLSGPHPFRLIDPFGGRGDLARRRLRLIGDPRERLKEDPLRLLRVARFGCASGRWRVAPQTVQAMRHQAHSLGVLSFERVRDEFLKALALPRPWQFVRLLRRTGAFSFVWPAGPLRFDAASAERALRAASRQGFTPLERWLVFLLAGARQPRHHSGSPESPLGTLVGTWAAANLRRLRMPTADIAMAHTTCQAFVYGPDELHAEALAAWLVQAGEPTRKRVERIGLVLATARGHGRTQWQRFVRRTQRMTRAGRVVGLRDLAIDGQQLMAMGIAPAGPGLGALLAHLHRWSVLHGRWDDGPALADEARRFVSETP